MPALQRGATATLAAALSLAGCQLLLGVGDKSFVDDPDASGGHAASDGRTGAGGFVGVESGTAESGGGPSNGGRAGGTGAGGHDLLDASDETPDEGKRPPTDAGDARPSPDVDAGPQPNPTLDVTWNPEDRRMALTDDSSQSAVRRVWLLVHGGATPHRLVMKPEDPIFGTWFDTGVYDVTSEIDAVSFLYANTERERVFYARSGKLEMYSWDGGPAPVTQILPENGYRIEGGSVGAVTFDEAGTVRMVVLAAAARDAVAGHYCLFENADLAADWNVHCSITPTVAPVTDVRGVVVNGVAQFYFKGTDGELRRVRRVDASSAPVEETIPTNDAPIGPSLFAIESQIGGRVEVGVIGDSRHVLTTRVDPVLSQASWETRPSLPNGVLPEPSQAALIATRYSAPAVRAVVYVLGQDGKMYNIGTTDDAGTWQSSWSPLGSGPEGGQRVHALGAVATHHADFGTSGVHELPLVFTSSGGQTTTLQSGLEAFVFLDFTDYTRPQPIPVVAFEASIGESSASMGPDLGIAAGTLRTGAPPNQILLNSTIDGASTWGRQQTLRTLPPSDAIDVQASASHGVTGYGGGELHLVDLEQDLPSDCSNAASHASRIVYRRGMSATAIARLRAGDPDLFVVAQSGQPSNPSLVVTENSSGAATAHVLYWDRGTDRENYWRLAPGTAPTTTVLDPRIFPGGPSLLVKGAGEVVHGVALSGSTAFICNVDPSGACNLVGSDKPISAASVDMPFGPATPNQRFMRDELPISVASSASVSNKIYAAYSAVDQGETSIFVTISAGGGAYGAWTTPVRVNEKPLEDHRYYFDPEIATTSDVIFVAFSAMTPAPESTDNVVETYVASSSDNGMTWRILASSETWAASSLPFDCLTQRWSFGDYRQPATIGSRTLFLRRSTDSGAPVEFTHWFGSRSTD